MTGPTMRRAVTFAAALLIGVAGAQIEDYEPVTAERLREPEPENWLQYRRTYDGWGHSPLDQITVENVGDLEPVWSIATGVAEGHEAPPMVNDGVMFVTTPENQVLALDAATGDLLWRYERPLPEGVIGFHPTNRGVGLWEDKAFLATLDAYLVALDATTGEVLWESQVANNDEGYYMTLAPLVVDGTVMVGVSGGELGIRGFIEAFDADSGESLWKTYTVPGPGEPGHETWEGDTWERGGAPIWITGVYDPDTNVSYWGTGNGAPWVGEARPGDNLYATSLLAVDVETGEILDHYQYQPNDSWDWDEVSAPFLLDVEHDGETLKAAFNVARNGFLYLLERSDDGGIDFVDATNYVENNVITGFEEDGRPIYDPERIPMIGETVEFCPSLWGGKDWPPAAYNPDTGLVYVPANENHCGSIEGTEVDYNPGSGYTGARTTFRIVEDADHIGELQAWDPDTMEQVWSTEFESQNWGPVLSTAGNLVFMGGTNDRFFRAFDAETGEILWEHRTNSGVMGVPTSFEVDGRQYIAVQSGWGVDAQRMQNRIADQLGWSRDVPQGGTVWVYALPEED